LTNSLAVDSTVAADLDGLTAVTLVLRHELDAAVAMPVVLPVDECGDPRAAHILAGKRPSRVVRPVFLCPEQGFGVVVVAGLIQSVSQTFLPVLRA